ncbi:MAG: hypothetical protein QOF10_2053 [Kribbellaceae bacterium]|nr:hypothetical protein [Kribbellaceae bacterium]
MVGGGVGCVGRGGGVAAVGGLVGVGLSPVVGRATASPTVCGAWGLVVEVAALSAGLAMGGSVG